MVSRVLRIILLTAVNSVCACHLQNIMQNLYIVPSATHELPVALFRWGQTRSYKLDDKLDEPS